MGEELRSPDTALVLWAHWVVVQRMRIITLAKVQGFLLTCVNECNITPQNHLQDQINANHNFLCSCLCSICAFILREMSNTFLVRSSVHFSLNMPISMFKLIPSQCESPLAHALMFHCFQPWMRTTVERINIRLLVLFGDFWHFQTAWNRDKTLQQ